MDERKKQWSDYSPAQQKAMIVGGIVEVVLTVIALRDLKRRPQVNVRGPKFLWFIGCFVQPMGPIAYLVLGRRRNAPVVLTTLADG